jgi:hypothetical protein
MRIDLVDLELLIRALRRERRLLNEPVAAEAEADPPAFYRTLDRGDLSDRLTSLIRFFREQKRRHAPWGVEVELELKVEGPEEKE